MNGDRLRILMTCDWYDPETGGGAERVAHEVGRRLAARGHHVALLATVTPARRPFAEEGMTLFSVRSRSLAGLLNAQVSFSPGLVPAMRRAIAQSRPDVIWAHSLQFQSTLVASMWARRLGIPLVVTAHIGSLDRVGGLIGVAARAHEATIGRMILRTAARATAVSGPVAAHVRRLAPRLAVDVVPNGVDLERFRPRPRNRAGRLRVGFMGRLVPNKGPAVAVRAAADLIGRGVETELIIAGTGPEEARLRRLAADMRISSRVRFEGFQSDAAAWLQGIDVLVRPSSTEGMPLVLLEALACGVPVVASDIPPNAALVKATGGGLLAPVGDATGFATALASLGADAALWDRLSSNGSAAAAEFTWDRTCALTERSLVAAVEARATRSGAARTQATEASAR